MTQPQKFRKRPVVIEALRFDPLNDPIAVATWCGALWSGLGGGGGGDQYLLIKTLEGTMKAEPGDWIIKGVKGGFYPCKPDVFDATYTPISEATDAPQSTKGCLTGGLLVMAWLVAALLVWAWSGESVP